MDDQPIELTAVLIHAELTELAKRLRERPQVALLRAAQGRDALYSVSAAAKLLGVRDGRAWIEANVRVRYVAGSRKVLWGDVLEATEADQTPADEGRALRRRLPTRTTSPTAIMTTREAAGHLRTSVDTLLRRVRYDRYHSVVKSKDRAWMRESKTRFKFKRKLLEQWWVEVNEARSPLPDPPKPKPRRRRKRSTGAEDSSQDGEPSRLAKYLKG